MSAPSIPHDVFIPEYASYNWIGGPSDFSVATNQVTGGDSTTENLNKWFQSGDSAYIIVASAMVSVWKARLLELRLTTFLGVGDGSRSRFLVFWSRKTKVGPFADVGLYDCWLSHHFPMVFLGFLSYLFRHRYQRFHRRLEAFRVDRSTWCPSC